MLKLLVGFSVVLLCGCSFSRSMTATVAVKDGQYGLARGNGDVVYRSETGFSIFCKKD